MRTASISPRNQAQYSWRGSYQRNSQNAQMQERSALGRLLNATIVVCGACYILYIAVYLGLDLKSIVSRPLRDTVNLRLRLHSNPAPWDGQEPLQLHSAGQAGAPDAYADADGVNRISDFEKTVEEPVPGSGVLADETRTEPEKPGPEEDKASAGSSVSDMSESAAAAGQPVKDKTSLPSAGDLSAIDPWGEDTGLLDDSLEPKSPSKDIVEGAGSLLDRAEEKGSEAKESAQADSFLQGLEESNLELEDKELSTVGNTGHAATSAAAEKATAEALESDRDPFLLDLEQDADKDPAGSSDDTAKSSASETAIAIALVDEDEPTIEDEDLDMLEAEDDLIMRDSASRGESSLLSGTEDGEVPGTLSESSAKADAADRDSLEEGSTISLLDEDDEDWEDDALLRDDELLDEDLLLESDDDGDVLDR